RFDSREPSGHHRDLLSVPTRRSSDLILTAKRTKPAVPFAGRYRIIDFALSNCVNSGFFDVMILAQYRPHSLIEHIGAGGPWDLKDRKSTRLNSSHVKISYAVFCLKKK